MISYKKVFSYWMLTEFMLSIEEKLVNLTITQTKNKNLGKKKQTK